MSGSVRTVRTTLEEKKLGYERHRATAKSRRGALRNDLRLHATSEHATSRSVRKSGDPASNDPFVRNVLPGLESSETGHSPASWDGLTLKWGTQVSSECLFQDVSSRSALCLELYLSPSPNMPTPVPKLALSSPLPWKSHRFAGRLSETN